MSLLINYKLVINQIISDNSINKLTTEIQITQSVTIYSLAFQIDVTALVSFAFKPLKML